MRKCLTIAVVNQKGGVGKTTVSVNLAYGLALAGKQVLLIDMDMQAHSSVIYCPELPANREKGTIAEALLDRACDIRDLIRPALVHGESVYNLDIVPSNIHLGVIAERIASRTYREKLLHNHLATVRDEYDFIILDCPPAVGVVAVNALYTADLILIPANYSRYALDGIADLFASIDEVKEGRGTYRVLRNGLEVRNRLTNQYVEQQLAPLAESLFSTVVRKNEGINQAHINGESVFTFDPKGRGAADYHSLVNELIAYGEEIHRTSTQ